jgi:dTDP-4-dehydrorhamnose reductase
MRVWVTGARGLLGTAVCAQLEREQIAFVATDRELDITDDAALAAFGEPFTHVIHCAAYTKVDLCETHEAEAHAVNAVGSGNVARLARTRGAISIGVSTDYVFDGTATSPYREDSACAPINAYGRTKLAGERALLEANPERGYVVRTSWLFGPGGPSFVATMLRLLAERPEVRVVDDQRGRPTASDDLAAALVALARQASEPVGDWSAGRQASEPGIYHFANAGEVTWFGLAAAVKELAGLPASLTPIATADYPTPARRPAYSVLATTKLERALGSAPRHWRDALAESLIRIGAR